jgi:hypothetical protein
MDEIIPKINELLWFNDNDTTASDKSSKIDESKIVK